MSKINKVLYNVNQRDASKGEVNTREEMWMARNNIGLDEVIGHATVTESGKKYTGIAPLGTNGLVPSEYLPSFVDNVVDGYYYNNKFYSDAAHTILITPDEHTTYVDITVADMGTAYRWTQASGYFQITNQNAFGAVKTGNGTVHADRPMDILTVSNDSWINISADSSTDTVAFTHKTMASGGTIGSKTNTSGYDTLEIPWAQYDKAGHITSTGNRTHTLQAATTSKFGVTILQNTIDTSTTTAATPKAVQTAIGNLDSSKSGTGTNVTVQVDQEDGLLKKVTVTDDTAKKSHAHGQIKSDGKVTKEAQTKKALLITDLDNYVKVGPAFGTASGDANLFLNKQGEWTTVSCIGDYAVCYVDSKEYGLKTLYVSSSGSFTSGLTHSYVGNGTNYISVITGPGLYIEPNPSSTYFGRVCLRMGDIGYWGTAMAAPVAWSMADQCFFYNKPQIRVYPTPTAYVTHSADTDNTNTYLNYNSGCYTNENNDGSRTAVQFAGVGGVTVSSKANPTGYNPHLSKISIDLDNLVKLPNFSLYNMGVYSAQLSGNRYDGYHWDDSIAVSDASSYLCSYVNTITQANSNKGTTLLRVPPGHRGNATFNIRGQTDDSSIVGVARSLVRIYLCDSDTEAEPNGINSNKDIGYGEPIWLQDWITDENPMYVRFINTSSHSKYIRCFISGPSGVSTTHTVRKTFEMFKFDL